MEENNLFEGLESFLKTGPVTTEMLESDNKKVETSTQEEEEKKETTPTGVTLDELEKSIKTDSNESEEDENKDSSKETSTDESTDETDDSKDIAKAISAMLKEQGFIDDEVEDFSKLSEAFETKFQKAIEEYKSELDPRIKELIDNLEDGVPLDEVIKIKSEQTRLENISDEDLEDNVSLQKDLITKFYKSKGFSDSKIDKMLKKAEDLDELVDEAKDALGELKEVEKQNEVRLKEQTRREQEEARRHYEKTLNELNKTVSSTKEVIPGIQLSEKEQKELFKMITTPAELRGEHAYTAAMIKREEDPIGFEIKLNYFIKQGLFDKEPKIDFLTKKVETKTASKFEKQIEELARKHVNKSVQSSRSSSNTLTALTEKFK